MGLKFKETRALFNRVLNNKMIEADVEKGVVSDEETITAICQKTFGEEGSLPNRQYLEVFNGLIIEKANEIAKPLVTNLLGLLANTEVRTRGNIKKILLPRKIKSKMIWSASGAGVDLMQVGGKKSVLAIPATITGGFSYETQDFAKSAVENFKALVQDVANEKLRIYIAQVVALTDAAIASGDIPANNVITGSNTSITDYNKLASRAARYGGRPTLMADTIMIDDLATKINGDAALTKLISDQYADELLTALNVTTLGRTTAFNLVNPFTDDKNTKVDLDVQKGYIVAGEGNQLPFDITEYGTLQQSDYATFEDGRVMVKLQQDVSIKLVYTANFFCLIDNALTL